MLFGERVAIYADDQRALRDYKDGAPSRSDGFIVPLGGGENTDTRITALLHLADQAASPKPALLLRNLLGTFQCCKCANRSNIDAFSP
jgi:hypothetical protein